MEQSNAYKKGFLPYALAAFLIGLIAAERKTKHPILPGRFMMRRSRSALLPWLKLSCAKHMAAAGVYLASDEAAYVTDQILTVSGGFGLATPVYGDLSDKTIRR